MGNDSREPWRFHQSKFDPRRLALGMVAFKASSGLESLPGTRDLLCGNEYRSPGWALQVFADHPLRQAGYVDPCSFVDAEPLRSAFGLLEQHADARTGDPSGQLACSLEL